MTWRWRGIEITLGVPAAEQRLIQERDGLRVQLADAQDRRAFLAAELQRLRDATDIVYAHRNKAQDKVVNLTAERDAAQARITELLGEAQVLRQEMQTLRERQARDGFESLTEELRKVARAQDGWRGRALTAEVNVVGVRIGTYGSRCPGCRGCNAGATAEDVCGGSAWIAAEVIPDTKTNGGAREISPTPQAWSVAWFKQQGLTVRDAGPGRITVYAPGRASTDLMPLLEELAKHCPAGSMFTLLAEEPPDPEIPLAAMRRQRDEARAELTKLAHAARAFIGHLDWHAGQIFLARTGTESEAVEALHALRYALPAPPLAPLGTAPGGYEYEAECADEDTTEPTPEEMPRAPTASEVRRMFAAMDEGAAARSPEKPDA